MKKKLEILGILYYVVGGLYLAGALLFGIVGILGGTGLLNPEDDMGDRVAGAVGCALIALVAAGLGSCQVIAATGLRRLRPWARTLGMVVAILDIVCCCGSPVAMALGIYGLIVLLDDEVILLFARG